ncbi:uncharacterized protein LOC116804093 [Drosophila mojavensis]|uniref:uncharacterized protein LOC116804093 n=1 Tax=Drosophila mojavensis TaxID=7230 RepID=UPI001CD16ADF|nr:uncharacterized protein LOC116804093 [Drosophila mojavensis]
MNKGTAEASNSRRHFVRPGRALFKVDVDVDDVWTVDVATFKAANQRPPKQTAEIFKCADSASPQPERRGDSQRLQRLTCEMTTQLISRSLHNHQTTFHVPLHNACTLVRRCCAIFGQQQRHVLRSGPGRFCCCGCSCCSCCCLFSP